MMDRRREDDKDFIACSPCLHDLQTHLMKRHLSSNFGSIEMFMEDPDEIK